MKAELNNQLRSYYVALAELYQSVNGGVFCAERFHSMAKEKYVIPFMTDKETEDAIKWACFIQLEKAGHPNAVDYLTQ